LPTSTCSTRGTTLTDPPVAFALLEIDVAAIVANWRALRDAHGGRPTAAVLKADAYGTGAVQAASGLYRAGCRHFFTAHLAEAIPLRALVPGALLATLNGLLPGTEAEHVAHDVTPVLGSLGEIGRWAATAGKLDRVLPALLHVDTGLARLGLEPSEVQALADEPARLAGIDVRYVMTHLVAADEPDLPIHGTQPARFAAACAKLPAAPRSVANSSGLFLGPEFRSDLARPGAALYGINPTPAAANPMRSVVRLTARVLQVRAVAAGDSVGYNASWRASRPSRVAVVGVGYADGFPRALSNRGAAYFDGMMLPLVGRVSMDLSAYDVTDHPGIGPGDRLELLGPHRSLEQVAEPAGLSPYEILTRLGRRYARVWHG
jgi:alanine racemase